jgi:hypothetical protein
MSAFVIQLYSLVDIEDPVSIPPAACAIPVASEKALPEIAAPSSWPGPHGHRRALDQHPAPAREPDMIRVIYRPQPVEGSFAREPKSADFLVAA